MPNRLENEASPYLRQHAANPVDWYPWGPEALERSKNENKPIFLSIGYSSCHWCHVMEQESFSDPKVAAFLREHFISIKVDREERPDLDHVYMTAVQTMTGQGGWPLNVFLTPELKPFYGGTYFPPDHRYNRLPFLEILRRITDIFYTQGDEVRKNADQLTALLLQNSRFFEGRSSLDRSVIDRVFENVLRTFDSKDGGVGSAPKFFHTDALRLMLRKGVDLKDQSLVDHVLFSVKQMAKGGVFDQVGGGFHRYSTDAAWKIPHFEKMLYDNALLVRLLTEVWQVTKDEFCFEIIEETLGWVLREMTSADGAFYSAIDADSEHEEGKFYLWSFEELEKHISPQLRSEIFEAFGVSVSGNFEGKNIFHFESLPSPELRKRIKKEIKSLLPIRNQRIWPLIDRKVLTSWNALMISAFSKAGYVFQRAEWIEAARRSADFLITKMLKNGRLHHCAFEGKVNQESFLEDHAYLAEALLDLFEATTDSQYFVAARSVAKSMIEGFYDERDHGFWSTMSSQRDLLMRSKEIFDGATPAPFHLAISALFRLTHWTGDSSWSQKAEASACAIMGNALQSPGGFQRYALVLDEWLNHAKILVASNPSELDQQNLRENFRPRIRTLELQSAVDEVPALQGKFNSGDAQYWICDLGACGLPAKTLSELGA